jgi:6-pyruvoyl tetrahydropterin synthase-like protein
MAEIYNLHARMASEYRQGILMGEEPRGLAARILNQSALWPAKNWTRPDCFLTSKELKQLLRPIVEYLDHQMINELEPFTSLNPSAENLARYFFDRTDEIILQITKGRVRVLTSTVFETDSSAATYRRQFSST